jgi:hypothetical protein
MHNPPEAGPWDHGPGHGTAQCYGGGSMTKTPRELRYFSKNGEGPLLRQGDTRVSISDDTSAYEMDAILWAHSIFTTAMLGGRFIGFLLTLCCASLTAAQLTCMREPVLELGLTDQALKTMGITAHEYSHILEGSSERRAMVVIRLDAAAKEAIRGFMFLHYDAAERDIYWFAKAEKAELLAKGRTFRSDEAMRASKATICI